jgi:hypothetical protein
VNITAAHHALTRADEQLAAAKQARAAAFEALVAAVADAGWRPIFRNGDRVVVEHFGGRSLALMDVVAELLRQAATV